MPHGAAQTFANFRGVVLMLWVFMALAACELVGVHLLLSLWSHRAAWMASGATAISLMWLWRWVASWKSHPHQLFGNRLCLHMGSLRHVDLPLRAIERVSGDIPAGALQARETRNLVPIAHPYRIIELRTPLADSRGTRRYAIRVDNPAAFDAAMQRALA